MKTIIHSSIFVALVVSGGLILFVSGSSTVHAANGGNGNHYGWGRGNGNGGGGGGGGGGPLPVLGVTLLGQAAGAAGLYTLWRRRRRRDTTKR
ncbi:MAG: hypothetical protein KDJ47_17605 [Hyphomicrobiaceae bacterium]|nr:hypothetical protein [Hyphomicrobiaceae bacterium]